MHTDGQGPQLVPSDLEWGFHSVSWGPARGVMLMSCKDDSVSGHRSSWCLCGLFLTRKNSEYKHMQNFYLIFILTGAQLHSSSSLLNRLLPFSLSSFSLLCCLIIYFNCWLSKNSVQWGNGKLLPYSGQETLTILKKYTYV